MSITTDMTKVHLTRSQVWDAQIKEALLDELSGQAYVRWLTNFPDGENLTIPSIGEATIRDYTENTGAVFDSLDTGEFQFNISEYKQNGLYITKKARQDAYYAAQLEAGFVPKMQRALAEQLESDIFSIADANSKWVHKQTAGNLNNINGAKHRWVATGTGPNGNAGSIQIRDFASALYALKRANVPDSNLIAIVDPSVEFTFNVLSDVVSISNPTPQWDSINQTGITSGMRFIRNIYGFDIYVSNYLARNGAAETIAGATASAGNFANNIFMSASSPDIIPFIGAWRQEPTVESEYNMKFQREEYMLTARYGLDLYRPENLVTVLTNTDVVQ